MMYHLQVNGKVIRSNLSRKKVMEFFQLVKEIIPNESVNVVVTYERVCFD